MAIFFASLLLLHTIAAAAALPTGIRSIYSPAVNPAAFSLDKARVESVLDFAWTPLSRPFPGSFGALWTATLSPPADSTTPVWFRASYGSGGGTGAMMKLWVADHLLINGQSTSAAAVTVSYYPLLLDPLGSLLRVEYAALGPNATAQVCWGQSRDGPWAVIPTEYLSPLVSAAEDAYQERRSVEESGWGTWDPADMLASVLLPSGLSFKLLFLDTATKQATGDLKMTCAGSLRPGLHAARGEYTEVERLDLVGGAASVRVETATTPSGELVVLVTTVSAARAGDVALSVMGSSMLPFSACAIGASAGTLNASCAGTPPVVLQSCGAPLLHNAASSSDDASTIASAASFSVPLPPLGASVAFTTAPGSMGLAAAAAVVAGRRADLLALFDAHGTDVGANETFAGLYTAVAWTTIYSHTQGIVNGEFGRSVQLYEWDTFLVSLLAVHVDGWAAYSNVIRVAKGAMPAGFCPGYILDEFGEVDNAKPPVGALALRAVFDAFGEAWVVELLLDKLVSFNAWWARERMVEGIVAPGSKLDPALAPIEKAKHDSLQAAKWETGLDNSPLYDTATFNVTSGLMSQWDVGLHALYISDALTLAGLARDVGRADLVGDLTARAAAAAARMQSELWCDEAGSYLNKDYVTGAWVPWTAPPTLYPLLTGAPTVAQVERMLARYYLNASEWCGDVSDCAFGLPSITRANPAFRDQNYWRGRIWGPMNLLVARGLSVYVPSSLLAAHAAHSLAVQSRNTFLVEWLARHHVMENYSGEDASGCASAGNANPWYHWGALTALVAIEDAG